MNKTINDSKQLQFLRFLAFLLIFIYHTGDYQFAWFPQENGAANAVEFFILLSGVVSGISSFDKDIKCSAKDIVSYMKKKIVKVYPLYFITTVFTITYTTIPAMIAYHDFSAIKVFLGQVLQLIKNLLLIQSWFPTNYFSYNGVGWFLSTIMFLYIINIPLRALATRIRKFQKPEMIFTFVFVGAYLLTWIYCYLTRNTNMEYTQYVLPASRVWEYMCGMALGYLICYIKRKIVCNNWVTVLFSVLEILALGLWIYNMYTPVQGWRFRITHWITMNIFLILVFSIGQGVVSSLFRLKIFRYLGDISFECFLLHQIVIYLYRTFSGVGAVSVLGNVFSISFCLIFIVMVASFISDCSKNKKH